MSPPGRLVLPRNRSGAGGGGGDVGCMSPALDAAKCAGSTTWGQRRPHFRFLAPSSRRPRDLTWTPSVRLRAWPGHSQWWPCSRRNQRSTPSGGLCGVSREFSTQLQAISSRRDVFTTYRCPRASWARLRSWPGAWPEESGQRGNVEQCDPPHVSGAAQMSYPAGGAGLMRKRCSPWRAGGGNLIPAPLHGGGGSPPLSGGKEVRISHKESRGRCSHQSPPHRPQEPRIPCATPPAPP